MSTLTKQQELNAKSAEESTSNKLSSSEKLQDSLQEQASPVTSQSPFSSVLNADMLTENSNQRKFNPWASFDGLHIYDMEGDE